MEAQPSAERITVVGEAEPKPKRTRRRTKRGTIQPEHIEALTVQMFGLVAMVRQLPHWAVQAPEYEVRPWAPAAAELLNEYLPKEVAERAIAANAGVAVVFGLGSMVYVRIQQDAMIRQQQRLEGARQRADELQRQEGVRRQASTSRNGTAPAEQPTTSGNGHATVPGSGAAPTHPGPIPGIVRDIGLS